MDFRYSYLSIRKHPIHHLKCRPDIVATHCKINPMSFIGRIWTDSLVHDPDALKLLIEKIGIDRIVLGSDYPFPLGEQGPGTLIQKCTFLSEQDKQKLLGLNALKFLGLDEHLVPLKGYN